MPEFNLDSTDLNGDANAQAFIMRTFLAQHAFITLAMVVNAREGVLDVRPMVHEVTGNGTPVENEIIYNVPVWRLQRGASAVIMAPVAGDIGLIAVCDRDISAVKTSRSPALPGSSRAHNFADAVYLGGVLNSEPTQYIEFTDDQMNIVSPGKIIINAAEVEITGKTVIQGIEFATHVHGGIESGGSNSQGPK